MNKSELIAHVKSKFTTVSDLIDLLNDFDDLSTVSTHDLVAELATRDDIEVYDVDGDFYLRRDGGGYNVRLYKSKLLVVRE